MLKRKARSRRQDLQRHRTGFLTELRCTNIAQTRAGLQDGHRIRDRPEQRTGRALDADHGVDPRPDACVLLEVARIGQVATAGPGDAVIKYCDLPMIAQIDPGNHHAQRIGRQDHHHHNPGGTHSRGKTLPDERATAQTIHQCSDRHAAPGGPDERLDQVVDQPALMPDVELERAAFATGIDVVDQPLQDASGIGDQLDLVTAHDRDRRQRTRQPCHRFADRTDVDRIARRIGRQRAEAKRQICALGFRTVDPAPAEAPLADNDVQHSANRRNQQDQQDPGHRDAWRIAPRQDAQSRRETDRDMNENDQRNCDWHVREV